jgi:hypothetical protein
LKEHRAKCRAVADSRMLCASRPEWRRSMPLRAPNPVKKPKKQKAKTTGAEGGGATGVPLPPSAALGVPDVTASMLPALVPTSCTARRGAGQNRNHGRLPTSTASAARLTPPLRHSKHAHLLSNIEKLTLRILGSLFRVPFWIPTGDLVCQLETTKLTTTTLPPHTEPSFFIT